MPQKKTVIVERFGTNQVDEVAISPEMTPFDGFPQNGTAMHTSTNQALSKGLIKRCLEEVDLQYGAITTVTSSPAFPVMSSAEI